MPLERYRVRNEYGLGVKELYKNGVECEDPKLVLDGVAVAGLVGLLRQLGDLSQLAGDVFHGLQEQVASTVSRSRKLVTRVQRIEASLPSLEKAILSQTSHIRFTYSPGSEWHPRIKNAQNHFICDDLPHFIMDSYEECHEPPRLQLLDRFDTGGPGSCLKRYSDPTFFRQASADFEAHYRDKSQRIRKARKIKRRKSRQCSGVIPNGAPAMNDRVQFASKTVEGEPSVSCTSSIFDRSSRSIGDQSDSLASKISKQPDNKTQFKELSSTLAYKGIQSGFSTDTTEPPCSEITWDEKLEIMEHMSLNYVIENVQNSPETNYCPDQVMKPVSDEIIDNVNDLSDNGSITKSEANQNYAKAIMNRDYHHERDLKTVGSEKSQVDNLSEVTSCSESDSDGKFHEQEVKTINGKNSNHESSSESGSHGIDEVQDLAELNVDHHEDDLVQNPENFPRGDDLVLAKLDSVPKLTAFYEGENSPKLITNENFVSASFDNKLRIGDVQYMIDRIENDKWGLQIFEAESVTESSKGEHSRDSNVENKLVISDGRYLFETNPENTEYDDHLDRSTKETNNVNLIEWAHQDDTDSGTDNFVDARYTIDSESESDYESQTRNQVKALTLASKMPGNSSTDPVVEKYDHDVSEGPTMENLENAESSQVSESLEQQNVEVRDDTIELRPECVESSLQTSVDNKIDSEPRVSEATPFGSTSSQPHALWTNGTLFGFQPSKPTVISTPNSAPMSYGNDAIVDQCSSKVNSSESKISSSVKNCAHDDDIDSNGQVTIHDRNRSEDRSSLFSLLSRDILTNGLRKIGSLEYDDKDKPNDPTNTKLKSPVNSPPPSPPLEHMKIYFRPIDGLEMARLKLKYPEGVDNQHTTVETFPSFQLVPESTGLNHDMGSDSDDDTFCRSYPCISEDSAAHLSESDSEQWESGNTSDSNNNGHAFFDGFRRISSTESGSSSPQQESKPELPPLPPLQWCVTKPLFEKMENKPEKVSQPKRTKESDTVKQEKVGEAKVYDQAQNIPATEGKPADEHGDLLHQIRSKSFNLKRIEAARSVHTPSVSTNNKITAILQKASEIRQAVASDDDSWSDT